ncbi:uncharacterized protein N7477_010211 [Penicillium maclennaniae]|uniref:uncharacterized protein n=1 Tax=Penicillium maclennaniae TaxID=1343394 RepID=UPI0025401B77|nr:uncharacterized protein N7477_010211 [Penicillium maclennaniae]KAJ5662595.1 hypothetical protein N7477_010211 [Penicillium maclennaniae]
MEIQPDIVLQRPLSRCERGPGLILVRPSCYADCQRQNHSLDPEPLLKWAEESFAIVQTTFDAETSDAAKVQDMIKAAKDRLHNLRGMCIYGSRTDYAPGFAAILADTIKNDSSLAAAVSFDYWETGGEKPVLFHAHNELEVPSQGSMQTHRYADVASSGFIVPGHHAFKISTAGVSHTRSLAFLKKHLGGPYFDLEAIWDEHTYYEFGDRSVEKTMATMVQEPYVNHVPTLTGGIGRTHLSHFYLNHFIHSNPDDTALELISRTVGTDRIVDEFIFSLTHTRQMDWLLPGIPATGKPLRIPFTSVVNIRGDRLYHEHIAWDQATALVQLGLMPEYLPFPYPLPNGKTPALGKRFEYRVPAAGAESAEKLENEHSVLSNQMFEYKIREVDDK